MILKKNNKTLDIEIGPATPDNFETYASLVIFEGDFKKYSDFPHITNKKEFEEFYKTSNYMCATPIFDYDELSLDDCGEEPIGYIFIDGKSIRNLLGDKTIEEKSFNEHIAEIVQQYERELNDINDCEFGELRAITLTLYVNDEIATKEEIYAYWYDVRNNIETSYTMQSNPEFEKPFQKHFSESEM